MEALTVYLSQRQGNPGLLLAAEKRFTEWDNEQGQVYDAF